MTISIINQLKLPSNFKLDELTVLERKRLIDLIKQLNPDDWSKFKSSILWNDAKLILENFLAENPQVMIHEKR